MKYILPFVILYFYSISTMAQDGHYWTEPYGNKSMLLNGTVTGSVGDLGAVYYNPARLGLIDKPAFLISADVFQLTKVKMEDGLGENIDFSETDFGSAPSLVAGTFKIKKFPKQKFAYSILTRNKSDLGIFFRTNEEGDIVDKIPGEELFSGTVRINTDFKEKWMGFSVAHPFNERFSIGVTNFLSIRTQRDQFNMQLQALSKSDNSVGVFIRDREMTLTEYSLVWKFGFAYTHDKFSAGLTVTTPKVNIGGNGSFLYEDFLAGIDTTGNGIPDDIYITNVQKDLAVVHKMPLSIGLGVGIPIGKSMIHLTAEWFDKIDKYSLLEAESFIAQSSGETISSKVTDDLESVFNYGIGLELYLNKSLSMFYSFSTDYSAVPEDVSRLLEFEEEYSNASFQADIWHAGGGFLLKNTKMDITLGCTYTFANQTYERPLDIPDGNNNVSTDAQQTTTLNLSQWRFLFGVSFPFLKDLKRKKEVPDSDN